MQDTDSGIQPWLLCVDLLNKIKTELITQAMDTLQKAIDSKTIEVKGSLVSTPDKPSETEMQMFIIRQLMEQRDTIAEKYRDYVNDNSGEDPKIVQQRERLRKFLLSVEQISLLMHYSEIFDSWMNDMSMQVGSKNPSDAIKKTLNMQRLEVLKYVLNNGKMESEKILTKKEREIISESLDQK